MPVYNPTLAMEVKLYSFNPYASAGRRKIDSDTPSLCRSYLFRAITARSFGDVKIC